MRFGTTELMLLLLIVTLVFGAGRLPKIARSIREAREELDQS
jgi:sec-independent protein translocase protein TatA